MTNRVLARLASRVLCGFPESFVAIANETVGNPVRPEIAALPPPQVRFAEHGGALRLLVLGGSQGARALNACVPKVVASLQAATHSTSATSAAKRCSTKRAPPTPRPASRPASSRSSPTWPRPMRWADLVICRAGALTLAELCAAGVGSVLVPFPARSTTTRRRTPTI